MPGQNLTRAEAIARAAVVSTNSYSVTLDLTTSETTFASTTAIAFDAAPGASTFVDLIAQSVERITLNGHDVDTSAFADSRIELTDLAASNELVVDATCLYSNTGEGLHRFVDPADGEVYLYSQFEVADARRVFAVFEQPDLKATFAFTVTVPEHWVVVSNEPGEKSEVSDDGAATWIFAPTPRLSSYVTAIVAGPYYSERSSLTSTDGREIPLGVYIRSSLKEFIDTDEMVRITRAGFDFYEKAFDCPYPFTKYDQLFVPEFNAGAMENAGCVTFTEAYVFRGKVAEARRERLVVTILHELAHMWFGDLVTMKWWNDLWLNESFAEFMSTLATAESTKWTDAWTTFNSLEKSWAYNQDQLPSTHPIVAEINDLEDVEVNFDGITYAKGASVLRQLVAWVGQEEFLRGVAEYIAKHAWGNTVLRDLLVELEKESGRELASWSALWLETAGVATLRPLVEAESGVITRFAIGQEAADSHPTLRPHRLGVAGYALEAGTLVKTVEIELDIDGALTEVPEWSGIARPDLILVNDRDLAYAKIRLDDVSLETARTHVGAFTDSLARSLVLASAWDMTRDGEWTASAFVDLVLGCIGDIADSTVIMVLLRQLTTAVTHYSAPAHRDALVERAGDGLLNLAKDAPAGSDLQFQLIKAAAALAETPSQLDAIAAIRSGELVLDDLTVDTDLNWDLLAALAAGGRITGADIDAALESDNTANGQQAAARARAALPGPESKHDVWDSVVERGGLPNAIQMATIQGFGHVHDREVLKEFVAPYFAALTRIWEERTAEMAEQIVVGMFPLKLAGIAPVIDDAAAWLEENVEAPAALRRLVSEQLDTARRAVAAQKADAV